MICIEGVRKLANILTEDRCYSPRDYNQVPIEREPEALSLEPAQWKIDEEATESAGGARFCQKGGQNLKTDSEACRSELEIRSVRRN